MKRAILAWLVAGLLYTPALADRLTLKDGRTFEGTVRQTETEVFVDMAYGTLSFRAADVAAIERKPTVLDEFKQQLEKIDRTRPEDLVQVAQWARARELHTQADELLRQVIALDADHAAARRLLGFIKIDQKWLDLPAALQLAQGKLGAGSHDALLKEILPALEEIASEPKDKLRIRHLEAHALLRSRQFARAREAFEALADKATATESIQYAAVAEVLKANADGLYVLTEPYPPTAMLLAEKVAPVEAGPASLARPEVLQAALRDQAVVAVKEGRGLMDEARQLELTEPEAAKAKYAQAQRSFDTADALSSGISRSYRVEIARRRIAMISKGMNVEAEKFDALKEELGKQSMTPAAYANLGTRMKRALSHVRGDLEAVLQLTSPFQQELALEVTDATLRIQRVKALLDVINTEFPNAP